MPQIGDTVRYLNAVGGGTIVRIKDNIAYVDEDGFETPVLLRECVVVASASDNKKNDRDFKSNAAAPAPTSDPRQTAAQSTPAKAEASHNSLPSADNDNNPIEETSFGDKANIVVGIECNDITHIGESGYEASIVNDSNFYLFFTWLTKDSESELWTASYAGQVEPNTQLILAELTREDVAQIESMSVQAIAYKRDKVFAPLNPVSARFKVDNTKFFKVHCFRDNTYFDNKVIAFEIMRDGAPVSQDTSVAATAREVEKAMNSKRHADSKPARRPVTRRPIDKNAPLVVDLHINELVDNTHGLSNADMLNLQVDTFRRIMDQNLRKHGRKIIFIHGKGEGVLRQAIYKELNYRYKGHDVCDASFREYGYGATQVTIR